MKKQFLSYSTVYFVKCSEQKNAILEQWQLLAICYIWKNANIMEWIANFKILSND